MKTVEMTEPVNVTVSSIRALVTRVQTTREALVATWTTAAREFQDVAPSADAELERLRAAWLGLAPGFEAAQLHTQIRKLVVAEHELREALAAMQDVLTEGEVVQAAVRVSVQQIRESAVTPQALAMGAELEQVGRELRIACVAASDETFGPASRLSVLVTAAAPRVVTAALTVLRERRAAQAGSQLGELRKRLESLRASWPGENEMLALVVEVEASSGQRLPVPEITWSSDLLMPPRLVEPT